MDNLTDLQKLQWIVNNIPESMKEYFKKDIFESIIDEVFIISWIHTIEAKIVPEYKKAIQDSIKSIGDDKSKGLSWNEIKRMRKEINKC